MQTRRNKKTFEKVKGILAQNKEGLRKSHKVARIGVFGSCIRGEHRQGSDIDILVEFEGPVGLLRFLELEEYLSNLLGTKVDLVTRAALKPHMGESILMEVVYV